MPGYVTPQQQSGKTSTRPRSSRTPPSIKQLEGVLEGLRGPDVYEARALCAAVFTGPDADDDRRAFLERAIIDAGGTPPSTYDAAAPILRSKGQRRTELARKARSPDRVAHAVVRAALDDMELSGRGAPAAQKIRDWARATLGDRKRLAAHRDRKLSPAALCRAAGLDGSETPSLHAAARMLARQLPGVFEGGLFLRRYLRLASGLAAQQSVTPGTVADAWNYAQNASSVESARAPGDTVGRRALDGEPAQLSRIRVPGPLTSRRESGTRTRAGFVFHWEPESSLLEGMPAQAGPAGADPEPPPAEHHPLEEQQLLEAVSTIGTLGAPAALAGEVAGRAPASSAGARRAQPPGGHAARVLTDSVWRSEALKVASACGLSLQVSESVLALIHKGGELGRNARNLARLVLDAELQRHGVVWSVRDLRVLAGDVTRLVRAMLPAGLLLRAGGVLRMPALATTRLLGLEGLDPRPSARLASSKMLDCLERWGVPREMAAELSHDEAVQLQKKIAFAVSERRRCPRLVKRGESLVWSHKPGWTFSMRNRKFSTIAKIDALGSTWTEYESACLAGHGRIPRKPVPMGWGWSDVPVANTLEAAIEAARCGPGLLAQFREVGWSQGVMADEVHASSVRSREAAIAALDVLAKNEKVVPLDGSVDRGIELSEADLRALRADFGTRLYGTRPRPRIELIAGEASPPNAADWQEWIERVHAAMRQVGRRDTAADAIDLDEAALLFADLDDLAANEHPDAADLDFPGWAHIDADDDMADFEARRTGT